MHRHDVVGLAAQEALKSAETFRLGAVLMCDRHVVALGRNRNINPCGTSSIHAEMDALWKAGRHLKRAKLHLVVVRVLRDDRTTACSKPCGVCTAALARRGIGKVTYTTGDPERPLATVRTRGGNG
jgi:tRNA(Arg) A34 adenosine deaminase TadA